MPQKQKSGPSLGWGDNWNEVRNDPAKVEAVRDLCLSSFQTFVILTFRYVYRKKFDWSEHHDEIANSLMRVWLGIDQNLIINIAPRYSKTEMICMFAAWAYGHNPKCEFLHLSYSDSLATRNSDKVKNVLKSRYYSDIFGVSIDPKKDSSSEWRTEDGGIFYATATGGQVTGFGAGSSSEIDFNGDYTFSGCILIDDPLKPDDAHTVRREQINDRWTETIKSRRNSPSTTPTICIMQRIHEGDFTAELLSDAAENFKLLKLKTLRDDGTALWPSKHSVEQLEAMKDKNVYVFSSQYQQEPTPEGGSIFKAEWWRTYIEPPKFEVVVVTADTAQKIQEHNDYSVFQLWGKYLGKIYLIAQIRGKWESPDLLRIATQFIEQWRRIYSIRAVYVEDKVSGTGLIQSLPAKTSVPVIPVQRNKDKVTRAFDAAPHVQAGYVLLPDGGSMTELFIAEASSFSPEMTHLHDDQVDTMMDAIEVLLGVNSDAVAMQDILQNCVEDA